MNKTHSSFLPRLSFLFYPAILAVLVSGGSSRAQNAHKPQKTPDSQTMPLRSAWQATASALQEEKFQPQLAIDGDSTTRWSSPFSDPHWLQIDLGSSTKITGFRIRWETAYANAFSILLSQNGEQWTQVYQTKNGDGNIDDIFIRPETGRYIKLNCMERATGWGFSLWEFEIKDATEQVQISEGHIISPQSGSLMDGDLSSVWRSASAGTATVTIDLQKSKPFSGIRLDWGANYAQSAQLSTSPDGIDWVLASKLEKGIGRFDILLHKTHRARFLKLDFADAKDPDSPFDIRDIALWELVGDLTPLLKYQIAAQKFPLGHYPPNLLNHQSYWTLLGVPGDTEESLFDEYGNIEPRKDGSILMPFISIDSQIYSAFDADSVAQNLEAGYLPLPSVHCGFDDFNFDIHGFAQGEPGKSVSHVRYRLSNRTKKTLKGDIFLAIYPIQLNPKWQHGGFSPISQLAFRLQGKQGEIWINGQPAYVTVTAPTAFGATSFGDGDAGRWLSKGQVPPGESISNSDGMNSGLIRYAFDIQPEGQCEILIAIPLHDNPSDVTGSDSFEASWQKARQDWIEKIDRVVFELPAKHVTNTLKSQLAYILLNQDGVVIQPGSRNYNRTWMRDGSMTSSAMLRMGLFEEARAYLEWYALRVGEDGLVPPILNTDGTVYQGWGSNIEWDSQGQFIYCLMEYYRFTQDIGFLGEHFDAIHRAMKYLVALRAQTLAPDYQAGQEGRDRFRGILPPSISHEGYSTPTHSNWDNFWAIRGWIDGIQAAEILDKKPVADWARDEYAMFKASLKRSIQATIDHFEIDYVPSSADKGDPDPTSIAIGLFPCEAEDVFPPQILKHTFEDYFKTVKERSTSGKNYAYTPYEIRNILALARLGFKKEAFELHQILLADRRPAEWNHFAEVVHSRKRLGSYIGDMPHTWVGSGYINSIRGMVLMEDDVKHRLLLLYATPEEWLIDTGITLKNFPTHFGTIEMRAQLNAHTLTIDLGGSFHGLAEIEIFWPIQERPQSIRLDGHMVQAFSAESVVVTASARQIVAQWGL